MSTCYNWSNQTVVPAMSHHPGTWTAVGGLTMKILSYRASGIYEIRNTINGHRYIGSAVNIYNRWKNHRWELKQETHHNLHLQRAWSKYGENSFVFSVLEYCNKSALIEREQFYIDLHNPEYNTSKTAGSRLGCIHKEETKRKISKSHLGLRPSEETRKKLQDVHTGISPSDETRKNMSDSSKGKYRGWSNKSILQFAKDGTLVNRFASIMDAERATGIGNGKIVRCAKGKRKSTGGFIWRYMEDE
jgi:group I intron endonuclease